MGGKFEKAKPVKDEINKTLKQEFGIFIWLVPAKRFIRTTRKVSLSYLENRLNTGVDSFIGSHIRDLSNFLSLLETIDEEFYEKYFNKEGKKTSKVKYTISQNLHDEFEYFVNVVPANRFNRNTRNVFLSYLNDNLKVGLDTFLDSYIQDLKNLFRLLEVIDEQFDQSQFENKK
ncbi:hypothetical protein ACX0G9_20330 [Flavitalea flava]